MPHMTAKDRLSEIQKPIDQYDWPELSKHMTQHEHNGPNWAMIGVLLLAAAFWVGVIWWGVS